MFCCVCWGTWDGKGREGCHGGRGALALRGCLFPVLLSQGVYILSLCLHFVCVFLCFERWLLAGALSGLPFSLPET